MAIAIRALIRGMAFGSCDFWNVAIPARFSLNRGPSRRSPRSVELAAPSHHVSILKDELLRQPEVLSVAVLAGEGLLCMDVIAFDMGHLHEFVHALQNRGDTTTRIFFAQEKSRMTLRERMGALNGRRPNGIANT